MGTIKKITAVKRRALCPKCFSVIEWDNSTFQHYNSENDSYYIICPAELNDSNCGQEITINKINPDDYLDNDIVFEPVESGEIISLDSEDINFNYIDSELVATNVRDAIIELEDNIGSLNTNINNLNGQNISYNNEESFLVSDTVQEAIDELKEKIDKVDEKEVQAQSITYDNTGTDLTSTDTQNAINELNQKINQIDLTNITSIVLTEEELVTTETYIRLSGLNYLTNMLSNVLAGKPIANYIVTLNISYPTLINKYACVPVYQNNINTEVLKINVNGTTTISITSTTITWKTANSRTINIPINSIAQDGSYTYLIS